MSVERYGNGPLNCFAIPGWGEDSASFAPLAPYIDEMATLYAVDPPGYGGSPAPAEYTAECIADRLAEHYAAACELAGERIDTLLGNCSGAILAAELALRLDPAPRRLQFIDPFAFLPGYFRVFLRRDFGRQAYNTTFANPVGRFMTNLFAGGREDRSTDMTESFRVVDHEVTYRYLQFFGELSGVSTYSPLKADVSIVTGEKTFAAVRKSVLMWREIWPDASVVNIADCGHLPIREAPRQLVEAFFSTGRPVGEAHQ